MTQFKLTKGGIRVPVVSPPSADQRLHHSATCPHFCPICRTEKAQSKPIAVDDVASITDPLGGFTDTKWQPPPAMNSGFAYDDTKPPFVYRVRKPVADSDRMYADSGHQVVNPEVMKQVLNEHFGELNPEPEFEALTLTEFARIYRELTGAVRWTNDELYKFRVYEAAIHAKLKKDLSS